jgi:hypothetical protein
MKFSLNFLVSILIGLLITVSLVYFLGIGGGGSRSGPPVLVATAQIEACLLYTSDAADDIL